MNVSFSRLLAFLLVYVVTACSGGGSALVSTPDTTAPIVVTVNPSGSYGALSLEVGSYDAVGTSGYCFSKEANAPAANDSCFQSSNRHVAPAQADWPVYVYARDAAGNVSEPKPWPCNSKGLAAAERSSYAKVVCVSTTLGEFTVALEADKAPISTENFLQYVNDGFYDGLIFHRVIKNFAAQGGGLYINKGDAYLKTPRDAIALEKTTTTGLFNIAGTIAMARTDNGPNTATSQFFINTADNTNLNADSGNGDGYAVFGTVIDGFETTISDMNLLSTGTFSSKNLGKLEDFPAAPPLISYAYQIKGRVDTTAPIVVVVSSGTVSGTPTLKAGAYDQSGVTAYCFSKQASAPAASDSCFKETDQSPTPVEADWPIYVYARDATGNVSAPKPWPCNASGLAAAKGSSYAKVVCVSTTQGEFTLGLEADKAPISTTNFLKYVNGGFYDGLIFHRIVKSSIHVVQAGGFYKDRGSLYSKKTGDPIALEKTTTTTLSNTEGTIAMARTKDPNTATSQFFINTADNTGLDSSSSSDGYAVFGRVIDGLDTTIGSIYQLSTGTLSNGMTEFPNDPPWISYAYQIKGK